MSVGPPIDVIDGDRNVAATTVASELTRTAVPYYERACTHADQTFVPDGDKLDSGRLDEASATWTVTS
jgi:hypothetical protein